MQIKAGDVMRRDFLAAGGAGALAFAALSGQASAGETRRQWTATETANVELVHRFVKSFYDPNTVLYSDIAPDGRARSAQFLPWVVGPDAMKAQFFQYQKPTDRSVVVVHETWAHGPIVITVRTDTVKAQGKPDHPYGVVGFFFVENGKIKEWTDYVLSGM